MTRRILIGRRDWMQEPGVVLSGGVWVRPLTNLLDYHPQVVAETAENRDYGGSQFTVDLGYQRIIGMLSFANLRATRSGVMKIYMGNDPTFVTNVFSLITSCWPQDHDAMAVDGWGTYSFDGIIYGDEYAALGLPRFFILGSAPITCRYINIQFVDPSNPNPLQIGHFGAWLVWEPPVNYSYNWSITPIDEADIVNVPGGSTEITDRGIRRRLNMGFNELPESEILSRGFAVASTRGKSVPLAVAPKSDASQIEQLEKFALYGTVSQDSALSNPYFGEWAYPIQIDQLR